MPLVPSFLQCLRLYTIGSTTNPQAQLRYRCSQSETVESSFPSANDKKEAIGSPAYPASMRTILVVTSDHFLFLVLLADTELLRLIGILHLIDSPR